MENDLMKNLPMSLLVLGAILGIFSFFSLWYGETIKGDEGQLIMGMTGLDFMKSADGVFESFIPLIIMILSVVALIVGLLPQFGVQMNGKVFNGILVAIGLIAIILFVMFCMKDDIGKNLSTGAWMGLITAIITIAVGGMGLYKTFNE